MPEPAEEALPGAATQPSRRGFLAGAAGLTGVALAVTSWTPAFAADAPTDPGTSASTDASSAAKGHFSAGKVFLQLGESNAGFLSFAAGGAAFADVVNEKVGADHIARKHIGGVKYEDITLNCGTGMSKGFYDWLSTSLGGGGTAQSGAVVAADFNLKVVSTQQFFNALISEVGMPALDAASKDAAKMTVKFTPEFTRAGSAGGTVASGKISSQKWQVCNFKFSLDGVDTSMVGKIASLDFKLDYANPTGGDAQGASLSLIEVPNLTLSVAASRAGDFMKWHDDFVVKGNNSSENEKKGSLSYLTPDLKTELFRLDFFGLGIFALDPDPLPSSDRAPQVTVQLYCDKASFTAGSATA